MTARGTQRWQCSHCGITGTSRSKINHYHRQFHWFEKWIVEGFTVKQLARESGHSQWMIRRTITYWLNHPPAMPTFKGTDAYLFDGTYIKRKVGLLVIMSVYKGIVSGVYGLTESPTSLNLFFRMVNGQGATPESITIDGNVHVLRAVRRHWPKTQVQRCLVHIQRQGLMWCRSVPKRLDAQKLRPLFLSVLSIRTHQDKEDWLTHFTAWEARYGERIAASKETGWVFSDLKRARSMILKALPDMFRYLDYPAIPRTTNALEGYFGRLKDRYHDHRGLSLKNRAAYFRWYFQLCPR
jgi:hypothetical protein